MESRAERLRRELLCRKSRRVPSRQALRQRASSPRSEWVRSCQQAAVVRALHHAEWRACASRRALATSVGLYGCSGRAETAGSSSGSPSPWSLCLRRGLCCFETISSGERDHNYVAGCLLHSRIDLLLYHLRLWTSHNAAIVRPSALDTKQYLALFAAVSAGILIPNAARESLRNFPYTHMAVC